MARRKPETLDDLLGPILAEERFTEWCKSNGLQPFTVLRLRRGTNRATAGTIALLAAALKLDVARVRAACEASRDAAAKE